MKIIWFLSLFSLVFMNCRQKEAVVPTPVFALEYPQTWPQPKYDFSTNEVSKARFELGRKLFYDAILSRNGLVSCGDCHQQFAGFAHAGHQISHGIDNQFGTRNSPALVNLAWQTSFFWDGGVFDLNLQPVAPIQNPVEMDEKMPNVLEKIRKKAVYPPLFAKAWGDSTVTTERFLKSLGQFMALLVSKNNRFDQFQAGKTDALNAEEQVGMAVFRQKCANCHAEPMFSDFSYRNNGLPNTTDKGRFLVTQQAGDEFKFKVPTLRNIAKTAPYMHDGRLKNLNEVIDHYRANVQDSPTLDTFLKQNGQFGLSISNLEKQQLVAFLNALTDDDFLKNKDFMPQ
jgi:cytochrome c peroxidase